MFFKGFYNVNSLKYLFPLFWFLVVFLSWLRLGGWCLKSVCISPSTRHCQGFVLIYLSIRASWNNQGFKKYFYKKEMPIAFMACLIRTLYSHFLFQFAFLDFVQNLMGIWRLGVCYRTYYYYKDVLST